VMSVKTSMGRQHELGRMEAGKAEVLLWNAGAEFNPFNTSSPYYYSGLGLVPMKPVRIRARYNSVTYPVFFGYVEEWPMEWPDCATARVKLSLTDGFKLLNLYSMPDSAYAAEVLEDSPSAWWRLGETNPVVPNVDAVHGGHAAATPPTITNAVDVIGLANATYSSDVPPQFGIGGAIVGDANTAVHFGLGWPGQLTGHDPAGVFISASLQIPASAVTAGTGDFSWELWVLGDPGFYFTQGGGAAPAVELSHLGQTVTNSNGTQTVQRTMTFAVANGSGGTTRAIWSHNEVIPKDSGEDSFARTWHHIVGARAGGSVRLHVDAVQVSFATGSVGSLPRNPCLLVAQQHPSTVGAEGRDESAEVTADEIAFYNTALDSARVTAHFNAGRKPWEDDVSGARINRILDAVGWASADRNVEPGASVLQSAATAGAKALDSAQGVADTEFGLVFMGPDGVANFYGRHHHLAASASRFTQGVFGDGPGELPYELQGTDVASDDADIWNDIKVGRRGGEPLRSKDAASIARYGQRTLEYTNGEHKFDNDSKAACDWLLLRYKDAQPRVRTLKIHPIDAPATLFPQVLSRRIEDRITVRRSAPGGGSRFDQESYVEGIGHEIAPFDWSTTVHTFPVVAETYWVLGDSTAGVLNSTTRLAF
jgi:hypothetical protein